MFTCSNQLENIKSLMLVIPKTLKEDYLFTIQVKEQNLQEEDNGKSFIKKNLHSKNQAISREYYIKNNRN